MVDNQQQLEQAKQLIIRKEYDQARAILRQLPNNPTAQMWLTKLDEIDPPPKAQIDPDRQWLERASQLITQHEYDRARTILQEMPDNPTARTWLAKLDEMAPPAKRKPDPDERLLERARQLVTQGEYEAARDLLHQLPQNATARQWLVELDRAAMPPETTPGSPPTPESPERKKSLFPYFLGGAALVTVLICGVFAVLILRNRMTQGDTTAEVPPVSSFETPENLQEAAQETVVPVENVYASPVLGGHKAPVTNVAFSADGQYVLSSSQDGTVRMWRADTGEGIYQFDISDNDFNVLVQEGAIAIFSSDAKYVWITSVVRNRDTGQHIATIYQWDVSAGMLIKRYTESWGTVSGLAPAKDNLYILTEGGVWNAQTREQVTPQSCADNAAMSFDGKFLGIGGSEIARLWNIHTGELLHEFKGHIKDIEGVAFSPDSQYMLTSSRDGSVRMWDLNVGVQMRKWGNEFSQFGMADVAYSPDSQRVAAIERKGNKDAVHVWSTQTGAEIQTFVDFTGQVKDIAFSPDGLYLLTGGGTNLNAGCYGTARLWNIQSGEEVRSFGIQVAKEVRRFVGHKGKVSAVAFSPDGETVLASGGEQVYGGQKPRIKLWNTHTGEEIRTFSGPSGWVTSLAFSPDGHYALSCGETPALWDVQTGAPVHQFNDWCRDAVFSPGGQYMLMDAQLRDVQTGDLVRECAGPASAVQTVAFSPDGQYVLLNWGQVLLSETETGNPVHLFDSEFAYSALFSPDGKYILIGPELWNTSGEKVDRVGHNRFDEYKCGRGISSFSPDGRYIATVENYVHLWDAETLQPVAVFVAAASINDITFSADGQYLLTGSDAAAVQLWAMPSD